MNPEPHPWPVTELLACCLGAAIDEHLAAPLGQGYLVLDMAGTQALDSGSRAALQRWLPRLPCPVIALGSGDEAIAACADLRVPGTADARVVVRNIQRAPGAALVLVQTLRALEGMALEHALALESMAYATLQGGGEHRVWLAAREDRNPVAADCLYPLRLIRSGNTLEIVLDRPAQRNAISVAMRDALMEALELVAVDETIERVVLRGNGACFSVGGDLAEFGSSGDTLGSHLLRTARQPARWLARSADRIEAYVHGACIGAGIELPAFASRVIAHPDAWFRLPELAMGLIPGAGGCVSVPRRIGRQRTAWMVLSGRRLTAAQALSWGLVDAISAR